MSFVIFSFTAIIANPKTRNPVEVKKLSGVLALFKNILAIRIRDTMKKNKPITKLRCVKRLYIEVV